MARRMRTDERADADLVAAALAGDRQAVADLYDRYSTVVFTVCVRLLGNRDDAADCTAEVFLRATERLHQLREPAKVKSWLYAIARNEVARRQRSRSREVPVEAIDELPWLPGDDDHLVASTSEPHLVGASVGGDATASATAAGGTGELGSPGAIERLLQEASAGLTDRDRAVAELGLRQRLQGEELADALGVTTNHAYVLVHRVRGRLEKAITAILVARSGRDDCADLQQILRGWDGELTPLLRKRVARHIDRCDICGARRKLVPAALFDAAPVLAAPIAVRHRVLSEAQVGTATGRPWSSDGFPRESGGRRRPVWLAGAAAIVVVLALVVGVVVLGDDDATVLAERASADRTATTDPEPADPSTTDGPDPGPTSTPAADVDFDAAVEAAGNTSSSSTSTVAPAGPTSTTGVPVVVPDPDQPPPPDPVAGSLVASPGVVDFGAITSSQALTLTNTGGTPLTFSLGGSSPALSMAPAGGQVAPGASTVVTVSLNRAGLGDSFAATLTLHAPGASLTIPVLAVNAVAPVIVSVDGPTQFGEIGGNPACAIVVEATDNTGVTSVRVVWSASGGASGVLDLAKGGDGRWRGEFNVLGVGTVSWRVVARDAAGMESTSAPVATPHQSFCQP